jgi:hypothetical protein
MGRLGRARNHLFTPLIDLALQRPLVRRAHLERVKAGGRGLLFSN